jgi:hypothetical protein
MLRFFRLGLTHETPPQLLRSLGGNVLVASHIENIIYALDIVPSTQW